MYFDTVGKISKGNIIISCQDILLIVYFSILDNRVTFNSPQLLRLLFGTLFDLLSNQNKQINLYLKEEMETAERMIQK